jgi:hypothetical protein
MSAAIMRRRSSRRCSSEATFGAHHSAAANTIGSINIASSSSARELFTRLDTGRRASKSFAAG